MTFKFPVLASTRLLLTVGAAFAFAAQAQIPSDANAPLAPPAALVLDAVPPVPASLAAEVARYTEYKPTGFASWHPKKMEMLVVRRHQNTPQLFGLAAPGAAMELRTDFVEPVRGASRQPSNKTTGGEAVLFTKDTGGNEVFRIYRAESDSAAAFAKVRSRWPSATRVTCGRLGNFAGS